MRVRAAAAARSKARAQRGGFTLVELAIVVVIIGILAAIGSVGFLRYRSSARMAEATNVVGLIKAEQEHFKSESGVYASISADAESFYPASNPGKFMTQWGGPCNNCEGGDIHGWEKLPIKPNNPVMYGYSTVAGVGGTQVSAKANISAPSMAMSDSLNTMSTAIAPTQPFYLITAKGDLDGDGVACTVLALSGSNTLVVSNEGE